MPIGADEHGPAGPESQTDGRDGEVIQIRHDVSGFPSSVLSFISDQNGLYKKCSKELMSESEF